MKRAAPASSRFREAFDVLLGKRSLDAAGPARGSRKGFRTLADQQSAITAGATIIRQRSLGAARNNPHVAAASRSFVTRAVGAGVKPISEAPGEASSVLQELWRRADDAIDADARTDFGGLQAAVVRSVFEAGEAFVRLGVDPDGGLTPLRLELIDPSQIPTDMNRDLSGGRRIRGGVEFDADGRRVAYHVYPERPGQSWGYGLNPIRIPAFEILHPFELYAPGQVRGLSRIAPVLSSLQMLEDYSEAELWAAVLTACVAITHTDAAGGEFDAAPGTETTSSGGEIEFRPGAVVDGLGADEKFESFSPQRPNPNYPDFVKAQLRGVAVGLGVPYAEASGDMSDANYSSLRTGMVAANRDVEAFQHHVLIPQFCLPVWRRFVRLAALQGVIDGDLYSATPEAFEAVRWLPPAPPWVDPKKDVEAEMLAVQAGFKSRADVIAERGYDAERVDADRAADAERERELGLSSAAAPITDNADTENA